MVIFQFFQFLHLLDYPHQLIIDFQILFYLVFIIVLWDFPIAQMVKNKESAIKNKESGTIYVRFTLYIRPLDLESVISLRSSVSFSRK